MANLRATRVQLGRGEQHIPSIDGNPGQNVRLAARLTGWKIDINALEAEKMPTLHDLFQDIL